MLNSSNEKNNLRWHDKRWFNRYWISYRSLSTLKWKPKKENTRPRWWLRQFWRLLDELTCEERILIKWSKLILQGQGGPKRRWVDFKRSLAEVIVPSRGTQPSARLWRDKVLPCNVVITSTHALPWHPREAPLVKASLMAGVSHNSDHSSKI